MPEPNSEGEIIRSYIDSAKSFVQLSSAGLVLPLVLESKVFGIVANFTKREVSGIFRGLLWFALLVAIGARLL